MSFKKNITLARNTNEKDARAVILDTSAGDLGWGRLWAIVANKFKMKTKGCRAFLSGGIELVATDALRNLTNGTKIIVSGEEGIPMIPPAGGAGSDDDDWSDEEDGTVPAKVDYWSGKMFPAGTRFKVVRWVADRGFGFVRIQGAAKGEQNRNAFIHVSWANPCQPPMVALEGLSIEVLRDGEVVEGPKGGQLALKACDQEEGCPFKVVEVLLD